MTMPKKINRSRPGVRTSRAALHWSQQMEILLRQCGLPGTILFVPTGWMQQDGNTQSATCWNIVYHPDRIEDEDGLCFNTDWDKHHILLEALTSLHDLPTPSIELLQGLL
jgi:hypothetical protein